LHASSLRADDAVAFRRALHVIVENQRVRQAFLALAAHDSKALGEAMYASHASMRDNYEASCPELDIMVECASGIDGVVGAKMTGAGFGGACVVIVAADAEDSVIQLLAACYAKRTGLKPTLLACESAAGVRRIQ
jgi:galactokinase